MIRARIFKTRAAHGYAWLRDYGPRYGLDVRRLHLNPETLDVSDIERCPLALAAPDRFDYIDVFSALTNGWRVDTSRPQYSSFGYARHSIVNVDKFVFDNGFNIANNLLTYALFRFGSDRDIAKLNNAWRAVIAADLAATDYPALMS